MDWLHFPMGGEGWGRAVGVMFMSGNIGRIGWTEMARLVD